MIMALKSEDPFEVRAITYYLSDLEKYSLINLSDPSFLHLSNGDNAVSIKRDNAFIHSLFSEHVFESGLTCQALS